MSWEDMRGKTWKVLGTELSVDFGILLHGDRRGEYHVL